MRNPERRTKPTEQEIEDALESSMPSLTPEDRRMVLQGMRILARVAIRSYMEEQAARSKTANNGDGEDQG